MTLSTAPLSGQSVPFSRLRRMLVMDAAIQAGVVGSPTAFKVSQRAAGANMSVDVAPGDAMLPVPSGLHSPNLAHGMSDAIENIGFLTPHATNPRVDQIVLTHNDSAIGIGSSQTMAITYLSGTATAGATLDNRNGAAALAANQLRLADVLVPAASSTVVTANIRDRRPWAWGAATIAVGNAGGDQSISSTSFVSVPLHTIPRVELVAGNMVQLVGRMHGAAGSGSSLDVMGYLASPAATVNAEQSAIRTTTLTTVPIFGQVVVPVGATHQLITQARVGVASPVGTVYNNGNQYTKIAVREIVGGVLENT